MVEKARDRTQRAGEAAIAGEEKVRGTEERDKREKEKEKVKEVFLSSTSWVAITATTTTGASGTSRTIPARPT